MITNVDFLIRHPLVIVIANRLGPDKARQTTILSLPLVIHIYVFYSFDTVYSEINQRTTKSMQNINTYFKIVQSFLISL